MGGNKFSSPPAASHAKTDQNWKGQRTIALPTTRTRRNFATARTWRRNDGPGNRKRSDNDVSFFYMNILLFSCFSKELLAWLLVICISFVKVDVFANFPDSKTWLGSFMKQSERCVFLVINCKMQSMHTSEGSLILREVLEINREQSISLCWPFFWH